MSENKNPLEPLAESLLEGSILVSSTLIKTISNVSILLLKTSWQGIELVSDVAEILYKIGTGRYEYEQDNKSQALIPAECSCEKETSSKRYSLLNKTILDVPYKEITTSNPDFPQYCPIGTFEDYVLPEKCRYQSIKKDINNTLKCYVGVNIRGVQEIDFFKDGSLLVGGASRWGKTGLLYSILLSLMDRYDSEYLKIVLVDFKQVDLIRIDKYKHVIGECVTDINRFKNLLSWIDDECNKRAKIFKQREIANIQEFNNTNERKLQPLIIVIDEIAQILSGDKKESDEIRNWLHKIICRCMAFGIYFIVCTQELSRDTLGKMKINFTQSAGVRCADKTASDLIIRNGDLEDICIKGRCKIDNSEGITEFQSYYATYDDFKCTLHDKRK